MPTVILQPLAASFHLDAQDPEALSSYLRRRGLLDADAPVRTVARAGDGNMNCTLRVDLPDRTVVVKQGRPWVEKYPHIAAPADRTQVEAAFYRTVAATPAVSARMPALIDADDDARVIILEHIDGGDYTGIYNDAILPEDTLDALLDYARSLHRIGVTRSAQLANRDMRALNHEHIFRFPLAESNGLALDAITPGLQAAADALKRDARFVERVHALGDIYLADGDTLVHGDFFPGSWLASDRGPIVIDPEFCFLGAEEFDYGVLLAHLMLGNQPRARHDPIVAAASDGLDRGLVRGFAGVEIMRRLIGVAQLPLQASLEQKRAWLECARELCQS